MVNSNTLSSTSSVPFACSTECKTWKKLVTFSTSSLPFGEWANTKDALIKREFESVPPGKWWVPNPRLYRLISALGTSVFLGWAGETEAKLAKVSTWAGKTGLFVKVLTGLS